MKKSIKALGLFTLLSISNFCVAQMDDVVFDQFNGDSKYWWTGKDETKKVQIAGGKYKLNLFKTEGGRLFHISIDPDFNKDFTLEATFRQIGGEEDSGIGFLWGYDPESGNNNNFCFASTGYVRSWISDDLRKAEREWVKSPAVKPLGNDNKLRLEKTGSVYRYIVNDQEVLKRESLPIYGDKIGIVLYGNMEVWMDDFRYSEKSDPSIDIPSGPEMSILYQEEYNDNEGQWLVGPTETYESSITNGLYHINFQKPKGGHYFYKSVAIHPNKDFEIQTEITQLQSIDDDGFGLLWGYHNPYNMFGFTTSADGSVKIYQVSDSTTTNLCSKKRLKFSNSNGTPNLLSVIQRNRQWYFKINNQVVFSCEALKFAGPNVGVEVNKRMHIAIDQITVRQVRDPINLVPNLPPNLVKEAITSINSNFNEISPRLSPDGRTLYIVRKKHPGNLSEKDDVWYSEFTSGTGWGEMKNIGPPINNEGHNMVVSVSPDNNSLLLMNTYNEDGTQLGAGVSKTVRTKTGWSIPVNQKIDHYYNHNQYAEMNQTANQKILLFAIERDDTYGERDLYVSFLKPDGSWSEPKNMGPDINTFSDEGAPFLGADDKTLYFSSAGWPGYGNQDIFLTKRLDDTWTKWSMPQNMGPTINSQHWDSYYTIGASGDYAIVASNNPDTGSDLYSVHLPPSAKPEAVIIINGKVLNANTQEPVEAEISYEILSGKREGGIARSNPLTGEYKIILNYGNNYGFHAKAKGFISVNENMQLTETGEYKEIEKNLFLVPLSVGQTIKLNNVFFVQSKPMLKSESYPELDRLADIMKENPTLVIELNGHTDNQGNKKLNQELSEKRVVAVMNYLLTNGVTKTRMTGKGFGGTKPIMPNDTEENRQLNRRVEFKIIKS